MYANNRLIKANFCSDLPKTGVGCRGQAYQFIGRSLIFLISKIKFLISQTRFRTQECNLGRMWWGIDANLSLNLISFSISSGVILSICLCLSSLLAFKDNAFLSKFCSSLLPALVRSVFPTTQHKRWFNAFQNFQTCSGFKGIFVRILGVFFGCYIFRI